VNAETMLSFRVSDNGAMVHSFDDFRDDGHDYSPMVCGLPE